ncbi:MAG TPA: hypothetical protein VGR96_02705 [Acidobacteriaceae bacterium]|nr:hypothetical protein [Acidobacteriaceae bacterium]
MSDPKWDDPNRYVADVLNLHASLDLISAENDLQTITRALIQGKERYFDLVFRRLSLDFDQKEAAVAMWMLDIIQARLASIERLRHQKSPRSGADTRVRKSRHSWA